MEAWVIASLCVLYQVGYSKVNVEPSLLTFHRSNSDGDCSVVERVSLNWPLTNG